jgi:hypothetical protein
MSSIGRPARSSKGMTGDKPAASLDCKKLLQAFSPTHSMRRAGTPLARNTFTWQRLARPLSRKTGAVLVTIAIVTDVFHSSRPCPARQVRFIVRLHERSASMEVPHAAHDCRWGNRLTPRKDHPRQPIHHCHGMIQHRPTLTGGLLANPMRDGGVRPSRLLSLGELPPPKRFRLRIPGRLWFRRQLMYFRPSTRVRLHSPSPSHLTRSLPRLLHVTHDLGSN